MTINPIIKIIRAKKLGLLIRDARLKSGKSMEECSQSMGISVDELTTMEYGIRPPTLPELELFAYYLEIPLEHFWGRETLSKDSNDKVVDLVEVSKVRQQMIGETIKQGRNQANLSIEELAQKSGISLENLQAYEQGDTPIPLPELEIVAQVLNSTVSIFEDKQGPAGTWFTEQKFIDEFHHLPQELQQFISQPVNRPYLELAIRLSELKVEKLRALGEGLLEITL